MFYLILATAIMLALLDKTIRGGRVRLLKLELEFKLFALRDQLRIDAIKEESPYNRWFDYMDTTLTRTIGALGTINPWYVVGFMCIHRNDTDLFCAYEEMRKALRQSENYKIERIYERTPSTCLSNKRNVSSRRSLVFRPQHQPYKSIPMFSLAMPTKVPWLA